MKPPASDNEYFWQSPFYRELAQTRMAYFATKKRHVLTSAAVDCPRAQRVWAFLPYIYLSIYREPIRGAAIACTIAAARGLVQPVTCELWCVSGIASHVPVSAFVC